MICILILVSCRPSRVIVTGQLSIPEMGSRVYISLTITVVLVSYIVYDRAGNEVRPVILSSSSPIADTKYGKVQGLVSWSRDGRPFYEYMGIPYAKPPVGDLRFEPPQPPANWADVRQTVRFGNQCAQFNVLERAIIGHEDCLFLNVFTPNLSPTKPMSVLVFVHGGGFVFGSANMWRPEYFMDEDVVLVTINYRLAALGFLNAGHKSARGNMGLKDQRLALKWVQENIRNFGGNPDQVTLFGESAGGASVHLQLLSSSTKGLFHKVISQSGTALDPWSIKKNPIQQAQHLALQMNCTNKNMAKVVECLKKLPAELISGSYSGSLDPFYDRGTLFGPSIETVPHADVLLDKSPFEIISTGKFSRIPFMIGYNSHEGLLLLAELVRNQTTLQTFIDQFTKAIPNFIFYPTGKSDGATITELEQIRQFYVHSGVNTDRQKLSALTNLFTDWMWAISSQKTAKLHSKISPDVYLYYFSYQGEFQLAEILFAMKGKWPREVEIGISKIVKAYKTYVLQEKIPHHGAGHADELALLFRMPKLSNIRPRDQDYQMSKEFVKLWVAFANDEKVLKFRSKVWSPLTQNAKTLEFFHLNSTPEVIPDPNPTRTEFLSRFHPENF